MEGLFCLHKLLQEGDYMCKLGMKDAYFSVPLHQSSRNYVRFSWSGNLYEFLCLCFGLEPAPKIFTKMLRIPVSVLRRINIWIVILNDMLIMGQAMEDILMSIDTVIFLLQHLGFALNLEKSILNSVLKIEFLGVTINSLKMCLSLTLEKVLKSQSQCQDVHAKGQVTVHEITKLLGLLSSTIQAVLPAQMNFRYLQQQ